jgi:NADH:ubiquinone oxidoreductase subunit F (NADH-binding)/NADH:ubiquinone oxidoreductase subunit E
MIAQEDRYVAVEQTMARFNYEKHGLVETLITAQEAYGCLPEDVLAYVADRLNIPMSRVYGVATFYDTFTLEPVGKESHTRICAGPVCAVAGAHKLSEAACQHAGISEPGQTSADGKTSVREVSCLGLCDQAPAALTNQRAQANLTLNDIPALLRGEAQPPRLQVRGNPRELTGPIGRIAPTDLGAHRAEGAFAAFDKAVRDMTPEQIIAEIKKSNLTGRGGAGFPTGTKLDMARQSPSQIKYVVCNFDESEPGTFKDRVMMEGNPFRVLEGLALSAYAIGAHQGYIFIRNEYAAATAIVETALDEMARANLLGDDILGTGFDFHVEIRHNAGAYVCGEETAQFEAIEGERGHPRAKPPYPTVSGLFGQPTAINNVETLAVVPSLILHGGEWFHQWGTERSVGLKLFCLSGHVKQPGVVEAPLGLTVRELIEEFGGGFDGEPQAILMGGAAGGFLHPANFDTPLTHEALRPLDVPIGSGAMMVFNQTVDLWDVLESLAHFFVHETCGQCAPCRLGTHQIHHLIQKVNAATDAPGDRQKLEHLGQTIRRTCKCGLGLTAANPSLTYLHHFEAVR